MFSRWSREKPHRVGDDFRHCAGLKRGPEFGRFQEFAKRQAATASADLYVTFNGATPVLHLLQKCRAQQRASP